MRQKKAQTSTHFPSKLRLKNQKKGSTTTHGGENNFLDIIKKTYLIREDHARMMNVVLPYIISCGAPNVPATNLISVDNGPLAKEKDSGIVYNRQKPLQLFIDLIKLFNKDKSLHIVAACSGVGSCPMACSTLGLKCVIFEKSVVKARLILYVKE